MSRFPVQVFSLVGAVYLIIGLRRFRGAAGRRHFDHLRCQPCTESFMRSLGRRPGLRAPAAPVGQVREPRDRDGLVTVLGVVGLLKFLSVDNRRPRQLLPPHDLPITLYFGTAGTESTATESTAAQS